MDVFNQLWTPHGLNQLWTPHDLNQLWTPHGLNQLWTPHGLNQLWTPHGSILEGYWEIVSSTFDTARNYLLRSSANFVKRWSFINGRVLHPRWSQIKSNSGINLIFYVVFVVVV
jgi:hypothetical protein